MTSNVNHKKHALLKRQSLGFFGRNEVAICGTTCDEIKIFAEEIRRLFPNFDIAFADADHHGLEKNMKFTGTGWQSKSDCVELISNLPDNAFQRRIALSQADCIIVNGNHFEAQSQILFCNAAKENSIRKRKDQLTNVCAIILCAEQIEVPSYIKDLIENHENISVIHRSDSTSLKNLFAENYLSPPKLNALIMAGGRSSRMGEDKSVIHYHGVPQYQYLNDLLDEMGIENFISCRQDQSEFYASNNCQVIVDKLLNCGPLGGIVSAFMHEPDAAWLVLACDVPLLDKYILNELIEARQHSFCATAFVSAFDKMPEPLIAIWEPKSFSVAMQFITQGYSCPRKVLMNSNSKLIPSTSSEKLSNVNTKEELEKIKSSIL